MERETMMSEELLKAVIKALKEIRDEKKEEIKDEYSAYGRYYRGIVDGLNIAIRVCETIRMHFMAANRRKKASGRI